MAGASIAIVAPAPVPPAAGGAERLWWGLTDHLNTQTEHLAELIKLPSPERDLFEIVAGYERFAQLDLSAYDVVVSGKYPAWATPHPNHRVYLLHRLRGLYDTYHLTGLPQDPRAQTDDAEVTALLDHLDANEADPDALPETFARVRALEARRDELPAPVLALPGPLTRRLVHWLDGVTLAPTAIRRYATLSHTVAARADYFPPDADVRVAYPMTHLTGLQPRGSDHVLAVSRLDAPKRLDLVIDAYRRTTTKLPLLIAGTGPQRAELEARAAGDPRIRLLGAVTDTTLTQLYNDARAVVFTPLEEDFGYITLEAMLAGTPVITTADAGGPTELVHDGENGRITAPDPDALAEAIEATVRSRRHARALGEDARRSVAFIGHKAVADAILAP